MRDFKKNKPTGDALKFSLFLKGMALMLVSGDINEQVDRIFDDSNARKIFINALVEFNITSKNDVISNLEKLDILPLVIGVFYWEWTIYDDDTVETSVNDVVVVYKRLKDNDSLPKEDGTLYAYMLNRGNQFTETH